MTAKRPSLLTRRLTVTEAAEKIGVAASTVYGMVARGELTRSGAADEVLLDPAEVRATPARRRGPPRRVPADLKGALYAAKLAKGWTVAQVAAVYRVTRQAVSKDLARWRRAVTGR